VGIFELLEAKEEELEAGEAYVQSLKDYWIAHVCLAAAVGGRLPEPVLPTPEEEEDLRGLFENEPDVDAPEPDHPPHHEHHH
jgi:outer membrane protein, heavy metal efflux system